MNHNTLPRPPENVLHQARLFLLEGFPIPERYIVHLSPRFRRRAAELAARRGRHGRTHQQSKDS